MDKTDYELVTEIRDLLVEINHKLPDPKLEALAKVQENEQKAKDLIAQEEFNSQCLALWDKVFKATER